MKVMSFNIRSDSILDINNRWRNRNQMVYDVIKQYHCDVIGLQEVTQKMEIDLERNISDYYILGNGRTKKMFLEKNNLFIKQKYTILENETFWLSKTPHKQGSTIWYSLFPRICTTAIIQIENNVKLRILNTHLDCLLPYAREYGLKKIAEMIDKYQEKEHLPCILMGDFNATPNSKLIKEFSHGQYSSKRLVAVQETNKDIYKETTMGMFRGRQTGIHIDYIFVSEEFKINDVKIIRDHKEGKYPSDHYPLIADLEINI